MYARFDGGSYQGVNLGGCSSNTINVLIVQPTGETSISDFSVSPSWVSPGGTVTASGRLNIKYSDGNWRAAGSGYTIKLMEQDGWFDPDDELKSGSTGSDGKFTISWSAYDEDGDATLELYAKFEGGSCMGIGIGSSQSDTKTVNILRPTGETRITSFSCSTTSPMKGSTVTFTGYLEAKYTDGVWRAVPNMTVKLMEQDTWPDSDDDCGRSATTNSSGYFSISWSAETKDSTGWPWYDYTNEMYARFDGGSYQGVNLSGCSSNVINVTIQH
jgi:hypothetical protein